MNPGDVLFQVGMSNLPFIPEPCGVFLACPPGSSPLSFTAERTALLRREQPGNTPGGQRFGLSFLWPGSVLPARAGTANTRCGGRSA
jgi:hypothetical protein